MNTGAPNKELVSERWRDGIVFGTQKLEEGCHNVRDLFGQFPTQDVMLCSKSATGPGEYVAATYRVGEMMMAPISVLPQLSSRRRSISTMGTTNARVFPLPVTAYSEQIRARRDQPTRIKKGWADGSKVYLDDDVLVAEKEGYRGGLDGRHVREAEQRKGVGPAAVVVVIV